MRTHLLLGIAAAMLTASLGGGMLTAQAQERTGTTVIDESWRTEGTTMTDTAQGRYLCAICRQAIPDRFRQQTAAGSALASEATAWMNANCSGNLRCFEDPSVAQPFCRSAAEKFPGAQCVCIPATVEQCPQVYTNNGGGTGSPSELDNPLGTADLATIIGRFTNIFVGISGSLALVYFVYGGFLMITAGGQEKKYSAGLNALKWAVAGLILIFTSYAILNTLFTTLQSTGAA